MIAQLRRHGIDPVWQRVDTEAAYVAALDPPPDIILSDYSVPGFDAPRALEVVQATGLEIPFVVVTGSTSEEVAVDCIKRGASDYLLKDRLGRLGPAVATLLERARLRRERAAVGETLRRNEERLRSYFELGLIGMAITSPAKRYVEVNDKICEIFGYERQELLGKGWDELTHPDDLAANLAAFERVLAGGLQGYAMEKRYIRKDGQIVHTLISVKAVRGAAGAVDHFVTLVHDIGERKRAETLALESERQLSAMFELASVGIAQADPTTGRWLRVNREMCEITGYDASELLAMSVPEITHPDDRQRDWALFEKVVRGEAQGYRLEKRYIRKNGTPIWVNVNMTLIRGADGVPVRTVATIEDIDDRKRAEAVLRASEVRFRALAEGAPVGIFETDEHGATSYVNRRWTEISGLDADQALGSGWLRAVHPEDRDRLAAGWQGATREGRESLAEYRFLRPDGTVASVVGRAVAVTGADGRVAGYVGTITDITESKRTEEALRESEERYRTLVAHSPDGIFLADLNGNFLSVNDAICHDLGFTEAEMLTMSVRDIVPESQWEAHRARLARILKGESLDETFEYEVRGKTGQLIPAEVRSAPYRKGEAIVGFQAIARNIQERRRASRALRASEARYRRLFEAAKDGVLILDAETGEIADVNPFLANLVGYSHDELIGKRLWELGPFRDLLASREMFSELKAMGYVRYEDLPLQTRDGRTVAVEFVSNTYLVDQKKVVQCNIRDISERKRAEEALHESEARYRSLFDNSPIGIYRTTPAGEIMDANPALLAMLGYATLDELRRRNLEEAGFQPDYPRAKFKETLERDGRVRGLEARWSRSDGAELVVRENAQAIRSTDGTVRYYEGAVEDVTERTRTEEARRRLAAAVDQASEVVMVTDTAGAIEYVNPAFERITGYTRDEAVGRNPRLLKSGRHDERFYRELWATVAAGRPWKGHLVNRRKDGTLYEEDATISPVRDERGVICNFVAVARDVTHEVALQQQLDHAQRIEAIGRLAGGIAHDFNNLLQAILSQLAVLELRLRGTAGAQTPLDEVGHLVRRGAALTRQLLLFARRGTASRELLDLNQVVEGAATLLRRVVRENVAVVTELAGEPLPVLADPGQLDQVLMNLAVNASDAMPEGGRLTLRTAGDASSVRLSVADSGPGVPDEVLSHVFEPFFTTKGIGKGTGLGLSVVHGIVTSHGGRIEVASPAGGGATFTIVLPRHTAAATVPQAGAEPGEMPAGRGERLLLVEDEDGARQGLLEVLGALGYVVTATASAEEAGALPGEPGFDLLLTDFMLPGISGADLAIGLRDRWPRIKVVVMSGYAEDDMLRRLGPATATSFLQKPFAMQALAQAVRRALDGDPPPGHG